VVDEKHGVPITLSIIYKELARYIGLEIRIIGFPSHVIVEGGEELILDPFNNGKLLSESDLQEILYRNYGDDVNFLPEYLVAITTEQILIRILRNLKTSYAESYAYDKAILCSKMILIISSESPEEIRDVGILEEKMSHYEKAIEFLNRYLQLDPNAEDADFILEFIRKIREKINHQ
jgi:regulator of sirC expression with transglutaminase-like and TPR domain